ncbi:MAG: signal recognition particle-docking protein FtsY, partial [Candidatus Bathyarchaeia archaeon]
EEFGKFVRIDGSILTKVDADVKGGAAVSVSYITKKPILFIGTGQRYDDLELFRPEFLIDRILGSS